MPCYPLRRGASPHAGAAGGPLRSSRDQTFTFDDVDDSDESLVVIRSVPRGVGLTLSKKSDGDVEVVMPLAIAERVARALRDTSA